MIADIDPYPAMKDSGVPWLGEVPERWETRRGGLPGEGGATLVLALSIWRWRRRPRDS